MEDRYQLQSFFIETQLHFIDATGALATLVELMALPAAIIIVAGGTMFYNGWQNGDENRSRTGKLLLMFGIILLLIVSILSWYFTEMADPRAGLSL